MITYTEPTGDAGSLQIRDNSSSLTQIVEFWIASAIPTAAVVPWYYTLGGVDSDIRSINFIAPPNVYVKLGSVRVNNEPTITFHLAATGNVHLGGPTDFTVDLERGSNRPTISLKVGDSYVKARPYVRVGGVWKEVQPWAKSAGVWKPTN